MCFVFKGWGFHKNLKCENVFKLRFLPKKSSRKGAFQTIFYSWPLYRNFLSLVTIIYEWTTFCLEQLDKAWSLNYTYTRLHNHRVILVHATLNRRGEGWGYHAQLKRYRHQIILSVLYKLAQTFSNKKSYITSMILGIDTSLTKSLKTDQKLTDV